MVATRAVLSGQALTYAGCRGAYGVGWSGGRWAGKLIGFMAKAKVITIGNFDGVHIGHQQILREARGYANRHSAAVVAVTFDPHPISVLRPEAAPQRLMRHEQKLERLHARGVDEIVVLEPTEDLLAAQPQQFIEQLAEKHRILAVFEGRGFRFGKDRCGDIESLSRLGEQLGFKMIIVEPVRAALDDQLTAKVSSSLIRWLLSLGRVADAARCLGQPYELAATIVEGEKRGRTLGFPTANLDPQPLVGRAIPVNGVYSGLVCLENQWVQPAAISIGVKPTFGVHQQVIEAHVLDFEGDLYGQTLTVQFLRWLRDQHRFPSRDALVSQLRRDVTTIRRQHAMGLLEVGVVQGAAATPAEAAP